MTAPSAAATAPARRPVRRRGVAVALMGPDGAGKTTVARALVDDPTLRARRIYMGTNAAARDLALPTSRVIDTVKMRLASRRARTPLGRMAVSGGRAAAKAVGFADRLLDRWVRYTLARRHRRRGGVVIFDRFVTDPRVGPGTHGRRSALRAWLLAAGAPRPDVTLVLDAPVDVLHGRKAEQTPARLQDLREAYLALARERPGVQVVDVDRPFADVMTDVRDRIERAGVPA